MEEHQSEDTLAKQRQGYLFAVLFVCLFEFFCLLCPFVSDLLFMCVCRGDGDKAASDQKHAHCEERNSQTHFRLGQPFQ